MNFLAHIYLSGDNDLIKIGNFMADGIRGKQYEAFPSEVRKGIILHRAIDTFTDSHPIFRQTTKRLHTQYHHYAGVIADVYYDHYLAKNWSRYHDQELSEYTHAFYKSLYDNYAILTAKTKELLPSMVKYNWLLSYTTVEGIDAILKQMDRRTPYRTDMHFSAAELQLYYTEFEHEFTTFFEQLCEFSKQKLLIL